METSTIQMPDFQYPRESNALFGSFSSQRTSLAATDTERQLDLRLVTAEGDKVTISLDARSAALHGVSEATGKQGDGCTGAINEFSGTFSETEMTVSVQGDLSNAEQRDIAKALKTVDGMMHDLTEGNLKPMVHQAQGLQGLPTIAGLEVDMSCRNTVAVAEQSEQTSSTLGAQPARQASAAPDPTVQMVESADRHGNVTAPGTARGDPSRHRMNTPTGRFSRDSRRRMAAFHSTRRMIDRITGRRQMQKHPPVNDHT